MVKLQGIICRTSTTEEDPLFSLFHRVHSWVEKEKREVTINGEFFVVLLLLGKYNQHVIVVQLLLGTK